MGERSVHPRCFLDAAVDDGEYVKGTRQLLPDSPPRTKYEALFDDRPILLSHGQGTG